MSSTQDASSYGTLAPPGGASGAAHDTQSLSSTTPSTPYTSLSSQNSGNNMPFVKVKGREARRWHHVIISGSVFGISVAMMLYLICSHLALGRGSCPSRSITHLESDGLIYTDQCIYRNYGITQKSSNSLFCSAYVSQKSICLIYPRTCYTMTCSTNTGDSIPGACDCRTNYAGSSYVVEQNTAQVAGIAILFAIAGWVPFMRWFTTASKEDTILGFTGFALGLYFFSSQELLLESIPYGESLLTDDDQPSVTDKAQYSLRPILGAFSTVASFFCFVYGIMTMGTRRSDNNTTLRVLGFAGLFISLCRLYYWCIIVNDVTQQHPDTDVDNGATRVERNDSYNAAAIGVVCSLLGFIFSVVAIIRLSTGRHVQLTAENLCWMAFGVTIGFGDGLSKFTSLHTSDQIEGMNFVYTPTARYATILIEGFALCVFGMATIFLAFLTSFKRERSHPCITWPKPPPHRPRAQYAPLATPEAPTTPAANQPIWRFCSKCGTSLPAGSTSPICVRCSTGVQTEPANPVAVPTAQAPAPAPTETTPVISN